MNLPSAVWWQYGILYEVYPRSFQDTNGDGVGDLRGIVQRLDYLADLGIKGVWIAPFFTSPMADFGYDISDYCNVDPIFGTLADFDQLLKAIHDRGLKLILDFVPNHTSDQHPWFLESRSSVTNPKRDWYLWRDPAPDGGPPNNWLSNFGGPGWTRDGSQYYYHSFLKQQPDVNWRNPALREAMFNVLRFWLDRGVDGFRVDVMWMMTRATISTATPDQSIDLRRIAPASIRLLPDNATPNRPEVHTIVGEMRAIRSILMAIACLSGGGGTFPFDRLTYLPARTLNGAQLAAFNFHLMQCPWNADAIAQVIQEYEAALPAGAWPNWVVGQPRPTLDRYSNWPRPKSRTAAMLLLTLRGTPMMYYGEEIGMTDVPIPAAEVQDPAEKNQPGKGMGRDPERTPMQWDSSQLAGLYPRVRRGFAWLADSWDSECGHAVQVKVISMFGLYRSLIRLRNAESRL